jgi:hypothetical protein
MQGMPNFTALPVEVHIVMHGESNAQATGTHAAVLAPQCVTLWRHNDGTSHHRRQPASNLQLPDWDPVTTAVLYPESPETPVVGLWGQLEQHGSSRQSNNRMQQQQPATEQQLSEALQQLSCGPVNSSSGSSCSRPAAAELSGCSISAAAAAAAAMHGSVQAFANASSSVAAASTPGSHIHSSSSSSSSSNSNGGSTSSNSTNSSRQPASAFPFKTVVILEGNWAKARTLLKHPKLASLPRLQLPQNVRSLFWRRGTGSFRAAVDCGVCTIEALYLLCRQLQPQPEGCWDDLLWLWVYQRRLVQQKGSRQTRQEMQQNYAAACGVAGDCEMAPAQVAAASL